mgnify:CR=1 FL=1
MRIICVVVLQSAAVPAAVVDVRLAEVRERRRRQSQAAQEIAQRLDGLRRRRGAAEVGRTLAAASPDRPLEKIVLLRRQFDELRGTKELKLDLEGCTVVPGPDGPLLLAFVLYLRRRARHPLEPAAHAEEFLSEGRARRARPPSRANREGDPRTEWEKPADWWKDGG